MLDGLLGRGFSVKCKSLMKATRKRIDVVRRRAEAKQRFLKEDLSKLLSNGLDINAYGRTEEFIAGMNLLSSYDFVEQSCEYIVKQLSGMQKQSECPEECREAIASLMFAAARFSDLPELRDLRDTFQQRYGNGLEVFVNQKFVEKLSSRPPAAEKRFQVLHDIASEFSIKWDSRGFQRRMATPPVVAQAEVNKTGLVKQRSLPDENIILPSYGDVKMGRRDITNDYCMARKEDRIDNREPSLLKRGGNSVNRTDTVKQRSLLDEKITVPSYGDVNPGRRDKAGNYRMDENEDRIDNKEPSLSKRGGSSSVSRTDKVKQRNLLDEKITVPSYGDVNMGRRDKTDYYRMPRKKDTIDNRDPSLAKRGGSSSQGENDVLFHGRHTLSENVPSYPPTEKDERKSKIEKSSSSSHKKMLDNGPTGYLQPSDGRDGRHNHEESQLPPTYLKHAGKSEKVVSSNKHYRQDNVLKPVQNDDEDPSRLKSLPPPYVKPQVSTACTPHVKLNEAQLYKSSKYASFDEDKHVAAPGSCYYIGNGVHGSSRPRIKPDNLDHEKQFEKDVDCEEGNNIPLPKPRSRRKHHKSSTRSDAVDIPEDAGAVNRISSSSSRKDHPRRGLQTLIDEEHHKKDDEERMIDKLLLHYSKKQSNYDAGKLRKKAPHPPLHHAIVDGGESSMDGSIDVNGGKFVPPSRSISLPHPEKTASPEPLKFVNRANTFQPDNQARHVHPKLPDYDDLAARFAALRD